MTTLPVRDKNEERLRRLKLARNAWEAWRKAAKEAAAAPPLATPRLRTYRAGMFKFDPALAEPRPEAPIQPGFQPRPIAQPTPIAPPPSSSPRHWRLHWKSLAERLREAQERQAVPGVTPVLQGGAEQVAEKARSIVQGPTGFQPRPIAQPTPIVLPRKDPEIVPTPLELTRNAWEAWRKSLAERLGEAQERQAEKPEYGVGQGFAEQWAEKARMIAQGPEFEPSLGPPGGLYETIGRELAKVFGGDTRNIEDPLDLAAIVGGLSPITAGVATTQRLAKTQLASAQARPVIAALQRKLAIALSKIRPTADLALKLEGIPGVAGAAPKETVRTVARDLLKDRKAYQSAIDRASAPYGRALSKSLDELGELMTPAQEASLIEGELLLAHRDRVRAIGRIAKGIGPDEPLIRAVGAEGVPPAFRDLSEAEQFFRQTRRSFLARAEVREWNQLIDFLAKRRELVRKRPAAPARPVAPTAVTEAATPAGVPPRKTPGPPSGEIPPADPISPRPRTLADMNREAKGMRAMTPEQRAAVMDMAKPIEGDILYQARPFNEHAQNLLGPDTGFMKALRKVPGLKQVYGAWNPAQMARNQPEAMIGLRQAIFQEIEKARIRFAVLRWWHDADAAFAFKRTGTAYGLKTTSGVWKATNIKPAAPGQARGKLFGTINDLIEHPERYRLNTEQQRVLSLAEDTLTQNLRDAQRAGVDVVELAEDYWPRVITKGPKGQKGLGGISARISSAKGYTRQRVFATVDDLAKAGYEVETDPRRVLAARLEAGIDTIAHQNARKQIAALPGAERPLERMARRFPEVLETANEARATRDAAKVVVKRAGAKATPEEVLAMRQAEANYITAMREVFAKKVEAGTPGYYELRLPNGRIAPQELVEAVGKKIDLPELRQAGVGRTAEVTREISQLLRTTLTNVDLAAGLIQGQSLFYRNNIAWWKSQFQAVVAFVDDPTAFVAKNIDIMDEGVRTGAIVAPTEFLFAKQGLASIPLRIPYIGPALGSFNRSFEWFITAGQTHLYKAARSGVAKNAGMEDLVSLGSAIRKEVGTESYAILGIRNNQRTMEALSLFAARFFRANVGLIGQSFTRGPGGAEARRAMGSLIAGGTSLLIGVSWAKDKKLPNMTDPYAPDWMQVRFGKTYFNPFGPMYPYFRVIARMSVAMIEGDPAKAATQLRYFMESKASLPFRALDIAGQLAYYGSANVYGTKIERNPLSIAKGILSEFVTPISAQEIPSGIAEGRPESAAEFIGLIGRPVRVASEWRADFEAYYDLPANEADRIKLAKEKGVPLDSIPTRIQHRKRNPEVDAKLFLADRVGSLQSDEAKDAAVRLMAEHNIKVEDIRGLEEKPFESNAKKDLRLFFETGEDVLRPYRDVPKILFESYPALLNLWDEYSDQDEDGKTKMKQDSDTLVYLEGEVNKAKEALRTNKPEIDMALVRGGSTPRTAEGARLYYKLKGFYNLNSLSRAEKERLEEMMTPKEAVPAAENILDNGGFEEGLRKALTWR